MESLVIQGGRRLEGTICVHGAKNASLPILAASVLTEETVHLHDVPDILDVRRMLEILKMLGCEAIWRDHGVTVSGRSMRRSEMPDQLSKQIRSSIFMLGCLSSWNGQQAIPFRPTLIPYFCAACRAVTDSFTASNRFIWFLLSVSCK